MSAISDKIKQTIKSVLEIPRKEIEQQIDVIVKTTRQGKEQANQIKDILKKIEEAEQTIVQVQTLIKTASSVITSLNATSKIAEAAEKAAALASSLNPAAAATALVQRTLREEVKVEIDEAKNALNVVPNTIQNFKKFVAEQKEKLKKIQRDMKRKKALREQRERKLNS